MFHSSNAFIIVVVSIVRLSVQPSLRQNPYCVSGNFLFFSSQQDMHMFIMHKLMGLYYFCLMSVGG
jgi:hypothetical protein